MNARKNPTPITTKQLTKAFYVQPPRLQKNSYISCSVSNLGSYVAQVVQDKRHVIATGSAFSSSNPLGSGTVQYLLSPPASYDKLLKIAHPRPLESSKVVH